MSYTNFSTHRYAPRLGVCYTEIKHSDWLLKVTWVHLTNQSTSNQHSYAQRWLIDGCLFVNSQSDSSSCVTLFVGKKVGNLNLFYCQHTSTDQSHHTLKITLLIKNILIKQCWRTWEDVFWNKTNLFDAERPNLLRKHTLVFMLNSIKRFKNLTTGMYKY